MAVERARRGVSGSFDGTRVVRLNYANSHPRIGGDRSGVPVAVDEVRQRFATGAGITRARVECRLVDMADGDHTPGAALQRNPERGFDGRGTFALERADVGAES